MVAVRNAQANVSAERAPCDLRIRPIQPSAADVLQSTFEKQSELARYFRFQTGMRRLPDELLYRLTHVDGVDRSSWSPSSPDTIRTGALMCVQRIEPVRGSRRTA